jgi:hypothetical protein
LEEFVYSTSNLIGIASLLSESKGAAHRLHRLGVLSLLTERPAKKACRLCLLAESASLLGESYGAAQHFLRLDVLPILPEPSP